MKAVKEHDNRMQDGWNKHLRGAEISNPPHLGCTQNFFSYKQTNQPNDLAGG